MVKCQKLDIDCRTQTRKTCSEIIGRDLEKLKVNKDVAKDRNA